MKVLLIIFAFIWIFGFVLGQFTLRKFKWYQKIACKFGWHSYPYFEHTHHKENDPLKFLTFSSCKWCKYEGQIDSQGNLF